MPHPPLPTTPKLAHQQSNPLSSPPIHSRKYASEQQHYALNTALPHTPPHPIPLDPHRSSYRKPTPNRFDTTGRLLPSLSSQPQQPVVQPMHYAQATNIPQPVQFPQPPPTPQTVRSPPAPPRDYHNYPRSHESYEIPLQKEAQVSTPSARHTKSYQLPSSPFDARTYSESRPAEHLIVPKPVKAMGRKKLSFKARGRSKAASDTYQSEPGTSLSLPPSTVTMAPQVGAMESVSEKVSAPTGSIRPAESNSEPISLRPSPLSRALPTETGSNNTKSPKPENAEEGAASDRENDDKEEEEAADKDEEEHDGGWGPSDTAQHTPHAPQAFNTTEHQLLSHPSTHASHASPVSTWTGARTIFLQGRGRMTTTNDIAVPNPRPWGAPREATGTNGELEAHHMSHGRLPPPSSEDDAGDRLDHVASEVSSELVRPSSAQQERTPVTIIYTDSEASPGAATDNEHSQDNTTSAETNPQLNATQPSSAPADATNVPLNSASTANVSNTKPADRPDSPERPPSAQSLQSLQPSTAGGGDTRRSHLLERAMAQGPKWYKREPHPMWCPTFASRRLSVTAPFPIRCDDLRTTMFDHFSRWGAIRCVIPVDGMDRNNTDRVIVVYKDESSVEAVLADPTHRECTFRSSYSRNSTTSFTLNVKHTTLDPLAYVWVKIVGERFDAHDDPSSLPRTRGAAPLSLPETVALYAVPRTLRNQMPVWRSAILDRPLDKFKEMYSGGGGAKEFVFLHEFRLDSSVPEKDFVPQLVDFFVEVYEAVPPPSPSAGWVFGVGSLSEAKYLMTSLSVLPGIVARYARETDRLGDEDDVRGKVPHIPLKSEEAIKTASTVPPQFGGLSSPQASTLPASYPGLPSKPIETLEEYPHLQRQVVLTYRGRLIREELVDGHPRYIDDAAIFVGRLVKEQETSLTLLKRFETYGKIVCVEYNPVTSNGTYGTARVLFQDASAAQAAIDYENGAVSFGSAIKVEPRKVLPMDVQARAMYVDPNGRAISPSIAHQYQYTGPLPTPAIKTVALPIEPPPSAPPASSPTSGPMSPTYPQHWMSLMNPLSIPQWMPPWFLPVPTAPAPTLHPAVERDSRLHSAPSMMPIMWQMGVSFYPSPYQQSFPAEQQKTAFDTPGFLAPPPVDSHRSPLPNTSPPTHPTSPSGAPTPMPAATAPSALASTAPATAPLPSTGSPKTTNWEEFQHDSKSTLVPVGSTFEDGVLKVHYDPVQLKQYREEHHLDEPSPSPMPLFTPPPPSGVVSPPLPLLPLYTGGHESHRPMSQAASFPDMVPASSPFPTNRFPPFSSDIGGRRASPLPPIGSKFPDPIGSHFDPKFSRPSPTFTCDQEMAYGWGGPRGGMDGYRRGRRGQQRSGPRNNRQGGFPGNKLAFADGLWGLPSKPMFPTMQQQRNMSP